MFFATSDSSLYHVVDPNSGKPIVRQQGKAYMFSSPSVAGDVVFIGVLNGTLEARDAKTGDLLWEFQVEKSKQNNAWVLTGDRKNCFLSRSRASLAKLAGIPGRFNVPFLFHSTGVKRRSWPMISKFASAEFTHRRSSQMGSFTSAAPTDFSTPWNKRRFACDERL